MATYALTGSASGIGAALASTLQAEGHAVISVDIRDADVIADLSSPAGRRQAVAAVQSLARDGLDGVVPLAGLAAGTAPGEQIIAVNYFGSVEFVEGLRASLARKRGRVVLLCSNSATIDAPGDELIDALLAQDESAALRISRSDDNGLHYMVGKRALHCWMRRNCAAWAERGVSMNAVAPGPIETPMTAPLFDDPAVAPALQALIDKTPLKRPGQAREVADCIRFLLSPAASYVCGSTLFIDGGYDAQLRPDHI